VNLGGEDLVKIARKLIEYFYANPRVSPEEGLRRVVGATKSTAKYGGVFVGIERVMEQKKDETREKEYVLRVRDRRGFHRPFTGDLLLDLAYASKTVVVRGVAERVISRPDIEDGRVEVTLVTGRRVVSRGELLKSIKWGVEGVVVNNKAILPQTMILRGLLGSRLLRYVETICPTCSSVELISVRIFVEYENSVIERDLTKNSELGRIAANPAT